MFCFFISLYFIIHAIHSWPLFSYHTKGQEGYLNQQSPSNPPQLGKGQRQPETNWKENSAADRKDWAVKDLPYGVYSKICTKLNIRRAFFDDFRMVAEKLGMNRDAIEFIGQGKNSTDMIFTSGDRTVTVRRLIGILHEIGRMDVAEVLEEWVAES